MMADCSCNGTPDDLRAWSQDDLSGVPFHVHSGVAPQVTGLTQRCWGGCGSRSPRPGQPMDVQQPGIPFGLGRVGDQAGVAGDDHAPACVGVGVDLVGLVGDNAPSAPARLAALVRGAPSWVRIMISPFSTRWLTGRIAGSASRVYTTRPSYTPANSGPVSSPADAWRAVRRPGQARAGWVGPVRPCVRDPAWGVARIGPSGPDRALPGAGGGLLEAAVAADRGRSARPLRQP